VPIVNRTYLFEAKRDRSTHAGKRSVYLVQRYTGEQFLASVKHVGYVQDDPGELVMLAVTSGYTPAGEAEDFERHARLRVIKGTDYIEVQ